MDSQSKPLGVSRRGVENFKVAPHSNSSISPEKIDDTTVNFPQSNSSHRSNARLNSMEEDDIVSEIERIVQQPNPVPEHQEEDVNETNVTNPYIHLRPPNDTHYPFNVVRKKRTIMNSPVCVWCGARKFMELTGRPKLRIRASGSDADWERWLRELGSSRSSVLPTLTTSVMPKSELLRVMTDSQLELFYKDFAGALIEMVLRELREGAVEKSAIMAQVRSSKYHKTVRVAQILSRAYEKASTQ